MEKQLQTFITTVTDPTTNEDITVISAPPESAPIDSTTTAVPADTSTTTEVEYAYPGDVFCDDNILYEAGKEPDNCANGPTYTSTIGQEKTLPSTGNETEVTGGIGILVLLAGAMLVCLSRRKHNV